MYALGTRKDSGQASLNHVLGVAHKARQATPPIDKGRRPPNSLFTSALSESSETCASVKRYYIGSLHRPQKKRAYAL